MHNRRVPFHSRPTREEVPFVLAHIRAQQPHRHHAIYHHEARSLISSLYRRLRTHVRHDSPSILRGMFPLASARVARTLSGSLDHSRAPPLIVGLISSQVKHRTQAQVICMYYNTWCLVSLGCLSLARSLRRCGPCGWCGLWRRSAYRAPSRLAAVHELPHSLVRT